MSQENNQPTRSRTYSWQDPMLSLKKAASLSGIEYLQAMQRGELPPPPIANTLDMSISLIEEGRVIFTVMPSEFHYNPIGMVHGGLACTLFDSAMGCAIQSTLPVGVNYSTLEIKVNFLKPLTSKTGPVYCEGKVIQVGGRVATAEGRMTDEAGKLYGHATTTCMIFRP